MKFRIIAFVMVLTILSGCFMACKGDALDTIDTENSNDSHKESEPYIDTETDADISDDDGKEGDQTILSDIPTYAEIWRPAYHFTDKNSFINDPNGLCYFNGTYHIYYQSAPGVNYRESKNVHWGHATSTDLVHFTQHDPVLAPDDTGAMWSGTAYVDTDNRSGLFGQGGQGIIAAYSTHTQKIGIAYSADGFTFTKLGIVIDNVEIDKFRDPKIFWDDISDKWTMVIAGGAVRFYQSSDLRNWTCVSENSDILTECPDFFKLKVEGTNTEKWVLTCGGRAFYVGTWNGTAFVPESKKIAMNGTEAYAGIIFANEKKGRILMMQWLNVMKIAEKVPDGKWNGAMSLVNELSLAYENGEYVLIQTPIEEYDSIVGDSVVSLDNYKLGAENPLKEVDSQTYVIDMRIEASKDFTLNVLQGENERVVFRWDPNTRTLKIDRSQNVDGSAILSKEYPAFTQVVNSKHIKDGILSFKLFVDTSCCDFYICDGAYVGNVRYQPLSTSRGASLASASGATVKSLSVKYVSNIHFDGVQVDSVLTVNKTVQALKGKTALHAVTDFYGKSNYNAESLDENVAKVTRGEKGIIVSGIGVGETSIRLYTDSVEIYLPVKVFESDAFQSEITEFKASESLLRTYEGYEVAGNSGNVFVLSNAAGDDIEYSASVKPSNSSGAVGLIFRATDINNFYSVTLDFKEGRAKLWKNVGGKHSTVYAVTYALKADKAYDIKVVAKESKITLYVNGVEVFTKEDTSHKGGYLGLNVNGNVGLFNKLEYTAAINFNFEETFDSASNGAVLTDKARVTVPIGNTDFLVRVEENSKIVVNNGILELTRDGTTTDAYLETTLSSVFLPSEKYTVETSIKSSEGFNARGAIFNVFGFQFVKFHTNSNITDNAGKVIGKLSSERYTKVALTLDCKKGAYEIFIDGVSMATGTFVYKETATFRPIHMFANGNSTLYIDYVKAYNVKE